MKTADRVLVGPFGPPFSLKRYPEHAADWQRDAEKLREVLPTVPHLLADNVARYVFATPKGYVLEEFPCLAPPWPMFWIEYVSRSGRQRRGVLVADLTDRPEDSRDASVAGAEENARENGYTGEIRWFVEFALFAENQHKQVIGPMGWVVLALDPRGRCQGNRWVIAMPATMRAAQLTDPERPLVSRTLRALTDEATDEAALDSVMTDERLTAGLLAAYQTLAFLHCRNVAVEPVEPRPKLDKRHRKEHGRDLLRFQTVRLDVPRRASASRAISGATSGPPPLHIVAGNFHHFGDCCPTSPSCTIEHTPQACPACGGHLAHGLLFGRYAGVYWVPQHARGNAERGQLRTDFDLRVKP